MTEDDSLEEITKEEFEDVMEQKLEASLVAYNKMARYVNQYLKDKQRFDIEYYLREGTMIYQKFVKQKIGFKGNKNG